MVERLNLVRDKFNTVKEDTSKNIKILLTIRLEKIFLVNIIIHIKIEY